jgi:hypothetical protein
MLYVFCKGVRVDQDIINVHDVDLVGHVLENFIHEGLEDCGSIGETVCGLWVGLAYSDPSIEVARQGRLKQFLKQAGDHDRSSSYCQEMVGS